MWWWWGGGASPSNHGGHLARRPFPQLPPPKSLLGSLQILSGLTHTSSSAQGEGKEVSPCSCSWLRWGGG